MDIAPVEVTPWSPSLSKLEFWADSPRWPDLVLEACAEESPTLPDDPIDDLLATMPSEDEA